MFKYASANFYTGISETVVVVGVQRLFVAMLVLAWLFGCVAKRNRQCAKSVGSIATKSMTVKNGGNTIDAVEGLALWVSHCISRACGLAGGLQNIREERTPIWYYLTGIGYRIKGGKCLTLHKFHVTKKDEYFNLFRTNS
ncbi:MAG: hypothetical protein IPH34_05445 [Chitinophagaceae bacterium]|jgi:hypothetical protein|nr:hypothetical protein [Chitinophagaceae bacterium]MBP8669628.1 hypothetical protein [Bacteroidia bacterium]